MTARVLRPRRRAVGGRAPAPPRRPSLDEAAHRRGHEPATVVSDLDRRRVVDDLDGHSRRVVERRQRHCGQPQRHAIEVLSIDPYDADRQAIKAALRRARIVVDSFHLIHGANTLFSHVRRDRERLARSGKRPTDVRRAGTTNWRHDLCRARHRLPRGARATDRAPTPPGA